MPTDAVTMTGLVDTLLAFDKGALDAFSGLLAEMEAGLVAATNAQLEGDAEEVLRDVLDACEAAITTMLDLQQTLQTRILASYFPARG